MTIEKIEFGMSLNGGWYASTTYKNTSQQIHADTKEELEEKFDDIFQRELKKLTKNHIDIKI